MSDPPRRVKGVKSAKTKTRRGNDSPPLHPPLKGRGLMGHTGEYYSIDGYWAARCN